MKHSVFVVLAVAALLVTACAPNARADMATDYLTPGATMAPPAPTDEELNEQAFLEYIRRVHPTLQFTDGDRIVTIAKTYCRMYDQGGARADANRLIHAAGGEGALYRFEELATVSGAGVAAFCPEHVNRHG